MITTKIINPSPTHSTDFTRISAEHSTVLKQPSLKWNAQQQVALLVFSLSI